MYNCQPLWKCIIDRYGIKWWICKCTLQRINKYSENNHFKIKCILNIYIEESCFDCEWSMDDGNNVIAVELNAFQKSLPSKSSWIAMPDHSLLLPLNVVVLLSKMWKLNENSLTKVNLREFVLIKLSQLVFENLNLTYVNLVQIAQILTRKRFCCDSTIQRGTLESLQVICSWK